MIQLILDTSAVMEYVNESIGVGEPLVEIGDEDGALFAVPLMALVKVSWRFYSAPEVTHKLELLTANPSCVVLADPVAEWRYLADLTTLMKGSSDLASAVLLAEANDAEILTSTPSEYPEVAQGRLILIEEEF